MKEMEKTAGIVLAGGQSSRMGQNKSLLPFRHRPLVEHMRQILEKAGLSDTYISGALPGYDTLPDPEPYAGPGRAMAHLLRHFSARYQRLLFIPVDMPFMSPEALRLLAAAAGNVFFRDHPLPCCLATGDAVLESRSVRGLLETTAAQTLEFPAGAEKIFLNLNTPEEWQRATAP